MLLTDLQATEVCLFTISYWSQYRGDNTSIQYMFIYEHFCFNKFNLILIINSITFIFLWYHVYIFYL